MTVRIRGKICERKEWVKTKEIYDMNDRGVAGDENSPSCLRQQVKDRDMAATLVMFVGLTSGLGSETNDRG